MMNTVTDKGKILWIEGKRANSPTFITPLRKHGFRVEIVSTGNEALARLGEYQPDLVVVYSASFRSSGKRICRSLRKVDQNLAIMIITDGTQLPVDDDCANEILILPFTPRKLMSRIDPLLPWSGEKLLQCGPIQLDLEHKRVRCEGRQARLTPHLIALLKILMEHPGEIQERVQLFRQVWHTEYTGDTRTLDVHMSWLRQALEKDPRQPQFVKTIRGVGYRLDI